MSTPFEVDATLESLGHPDGGPHDPSGGPPTIIVGTPFHLVLQARHDPGKIALLPETLDLGSKLGERAFARQHVRQQEEGAEVDIYRLELVPFESGELTIPAIPLAVGSTVAKTPELVLTVETTFSAEELPIATSTQPEALAALEEMAAPDPPARRIDVFDPTLLWVLCGAAVVVLVTYLVLRRRATVPEEAKLEKPAPKRPAHEIALEALDTLKIKNLMAAGEYKEHYTELSMILRIYLGDRYTFESVELTLEELLEALRSRVSKELEVDTLMALLATADHVKFAKRIPVLAEGYEDLERARRIVTRSTPEQAQATNGELPA